jgi:hypothetical protein
VLCDREGFFKCGILDYGLDEAQSGAVAFRFRAKLTHIFDFADEPTEADPELVREPSWLAWPGEHDFESYGKIWIVGKDGKLNEDGIKRMVEVLGWNADLKAIEDKTFAPKEFVGNVKPNEYQGKTSYNIEWVDPLDHTPTKGGGIKANVTGDKLSQLEAKYGSPLRALAGSLRKPAAGSKPAAPPPKKEKATAGASNGDGIPFSVVGLIASLATLSSMWC